MTGKRGIEQHRCVLQADAHAGSMEKSLATDSAQALEKLEQRVLGADAPRDVQDI